MKRQLFYIIAMLFPVVSMASGINIEVIGKEPIYLYGCPKFQLIHEGNEEVTDIS